MRCAEPERHHLDGQRETPQHLDTLGLIGDHDHARARCGDDLLVEERATGALDEPQLAVNLVGAIDREVEHGRGVERGERDALGLSLHACRLRGRHALNLEARAHALAQQRDDVLGGGAGTEPEPHAVVHAFERARRRGSRLVFTAHAPRLASSMYVSSTNSSMPWSEPSRPSPDSLTPPNGASSVEMMPELTPTMPYSSASATRNTRPRSRA